jgi:hypothetical protein
VAGPKFSSALVHISENPERERERERRKDSVTDTLQFVLNHETTICIFETMLNTALLIVYIS